MNIDLRTIVLVTILFNITFGIGMFISNQYKRSFEGIRMIGIGFLLTALGFILMLLRHIIDPFLTVVVCNTVIVMGVALTYRGLFHFYKKNIYSIIYDLISIAVFFSLFCYYLLFENNINMRIIIICIYLIYYYAISLYAVLHKPAYDKPSANWFIGSILIVAIIFYVFRVFYTIFEPKILNFMQAGIVHSIAILIFSLWSVIICFGVFIVMNMVIVEEKQSLLKEFNHRVKNNLTLVTSLIGLKSLNSNGDNDLIDVQKQIDAIRFTHELLMESDDFIEIDFKDYVDKLLSNLFRFYHNSIKVESQIEMGKINDKTAKTLGLIINETATNAIKYSGHQDNRIKYSVELKEDENQDEFILKIYNTGNPFPDDIGLENSSTLGLQLISALTEQLNGSIKLERKPYPSFTINFSKE